MPRIHGTAFIADGAKVIGSVSIGEYSGAWYNAAIRGDENHITIGDYVSVGHGAVVHVCEI